MCGIAGYVGPKNSVEIVFDQLRRLEYRGYDSAGIAFAEDGTIQVLKRAGKLSELGKLVDEGRHEAHLAIGHSRWATHGSPNDINAHPHFDQYENIALIHNGIIENYLDLKAELIEQGHAFRSETDTEVAAHLIGAEFTRIGNLEEAVRRAVRRLRGAFALVVISREDRNKIVATRNASPLVIGIGQGEMLLASDIPALIPYTRDVLVLEENQVAVLTPDQVVITDDEGGILSYKTLHVDWDLEVAEKAGYEHFMLKEIMEQPEVMRQCLAGRVDESNRIRFEQIFSDNVWHEVDRVAIVACGTAHHAGLMGKFLFEKLLRLPTDVYYSSEFRYSDPVVSPKTLVICISQSGETADTLAALKLCQERRLRTLGIVNVIGSSIARACDRTIFTQAGPEISVASTKAYTAQVMVLTLLALYIAQVKEAPGVRVNQAVAALKNMEQLTRRTLTAQEKVIELAEKVKDSDLFFFLGRGPDSYVSMEAALKLKEIAYIATQEQPAGEMKHGPLALVEPGVVGVFTSTEAAMREKLGSNMREFQARGGTVVVFTSEDDTLLPQFADVAISFPSVGFEYLNPLQAIVLQQLLAYHVARLRGCEIDQPRNLAKSVTVE